MLEQFILQWWHIAAQVALLIAWFVRVEQGMRTNAREIERLWKQRKEDLEAAQAARADTNDLLRDLRSDVRALTNLILERRQ